MNDTSYEAAWADEEKAVAPAEKPMGKQEEKPGASAPAPAVAEAAAASNAAPAGGPPLVAVVAAVEPMSGPEAKAKHEAAMASDAEEFQKAFAETPDVK
jgi:hypothetical protein